MKNQPTAQDSYDTHLKAAREPNWQPIETAPKDGTHFLGFVEWGEAILECQFVCYYSAAKGRFAIVCAPDVEIHVSHWMPLPEPPKETK